MSSVLVGKLLEKRGAVLDGTKWVLERYCMKIRRGWN
jgi:hypothetical protein